MLCCITAYPGTSGSHIMYKNVVFKCWARKRIHYLCGSVKEKICHRSPIDITRQASWYQTVILGIDFSTPWWSVTFYPPPPIYDRFFIANHTRFLLHPGRLSHIFTMFTLAVSIDVSWFNHLLASPWYINFEHVSSLATFVTYSKTILYPYRFVCLIWFFMSHQQSFSYKGMGLPGFNQY